jgi:hypothetical protein
LANKGWKILNFAGLHYALLAAAPCLGLALTFPQLKTILTIS